MPMMSEAVNKADWERAEAASPPLKRKVKPRPEPEHPKVNNQLAFKDLPLDRFVRLVTAKQNTLKNKDGMRFIGFDVAIEFKCKEKKKKPLEVIISDTVEPETYVQEGWLQEGDWYQF